MNTPTAPGTLSCSLHEQLQQRLLELPFDAFAVLIARLLTSLGYQSVHFTGRRDFKGRNGRDGATGYDMTATKRGRTILIQIKQFKENRPIFQRSLDELRGVTLRSGAAEALLITTGTISPSVNRNASRLTPIAPVTTVSGEDLVKLLCRFQVGVTSDGSIDNAFLELITRDAKGNRPSDCTGMASFIVTVGVAKVSRKIRSVPR